jgi:hypothetical protein
MSQKVGFPAKVGAIILVLWGILHLWVPYNGFSSYFKHGNCFDMFIGGKNVPKSEFVPPTDPKTLYAINNVFFDFITSIGGYGILSFIVAYMLWYGESPWIAYLITLLCIGAADTAFLFFMILSGVIELSIPVILGPLLWFLAIIITPFGLPRS